MTASKSVPWRRTWSARRTASGASWGPSVVPRREHGDGATPRARRAALLALPKNRRLGAFDAPRAVRAISARFGSLMVVRKRSRAHQYGELAISGGRRWPARKSPARPGRCASPSTPTTGRPPCNCSTASRGLRWFCSMGADVDGLGTGLCMKPGSIIGGALASSSRTAHRAAHATPSRRCGFGTPSPLDKNQSLPRPQS